MIKRIGFACKWIDRPDQIKGIKPTDECKALNTGSTTVAWLNRQTKQVAEQKLYDLMVGNIEAVRKLVDRVGDLDENLRMVRLSSDILPVYTQSVWGKYWKSADVRAYCEKAFGEVGELARKKNVRLSMHPGQFTVLASETPEIVERSIEEFEYHTDMVRWMGYGKSFQDFKINVHISGRKGPQGIIDVLPRLSPEARNCITIENDEMCWGIESSLELEKHCALVLDIHHHWIRTGEYIQASDDRCKRVIDSWRGVRPAIHYSYSREEWVGHIPADEKPDWSKLLELGYKKQKLRAHSNFYWNTAVNDWALSFSDTHDIMCESKGKNISSSTLYQQRLSRGL